MFCYLIIVSFQIFCHPMRGWYTIVITHFYESEKAPRFELYIFLNLNMMHLHATAMVSANHVTGGIINYLIFTDAQIPQYHIKIICIP